MKQRHIIKMKIIEIEQALERIERRNPNYINSIKWKELSAQQNELYNELKKCLEEK